MSVFRCNKQIYVQLIDDLAGKDLALLTSSKGIEGGTKCESAAKVVRPSPRKAQAAMGITEVVLTVTVICSTAG